MATAGTLMFISCASPYSTILGAHVAAQWVLDMAGGMQGFGSPRLHAQPAVVGVHGDPPAPIPWTQGRFSGARPGLWRTQTERPRAVQATSDEGRGGGRWCDSPNDLCTPADPFPDPWIADRCAFQKRAQPSPPPPPTWFTTQTTVLITQTRSRITPMSMHPKRSRSRPDEDEIRTREPKTTAWDGHPEPGA